MDKGFTMMGNGPYRFMGWLYWLDDFVIRRGRKLCINFVKVIRGGRTKI